MNQVPDIKIHKLSDSKFHLITQKTDPLAKKDLIRPKNLSERTLMIGGGSSVKLKALQQHISHTVDVQHFNSQNHDTALTIVAPGF